MASIDIFNSDAFSAIEMAAAINKVPFQPSRLGQMGIFTPRPVRTKGVWIEEREGVLNLIQTSNRGAPLDQRSTEKRAARNFPTVRIAKGDRLMADEIQDIRAFGTESELMQVIDEVSRRLNGPVGLRREVDLTMEHMRLGAVQGVVTDADGTTINDWFTEFGIAQATEIDFDLDSASPASGVVRKKCNQAVRQMMRAANGAWVNGQTLVHALCGDAFWDDLTAHAEVRQTYLNTMQAVELRDGLAFETFRYGGIVWENYRGTDDASTVAIGTDKAKFFPVNAPGVFTTALSPAETFDFVNTPGQLVYPMIIPDEKRNAFVDIEVYSYPLHICTRPGMLQRAKRT